jgi:C4-dicarboxylate transporter DctM subunit
MGMGLFVVQKISGVSFERLVYALLPFHLALVVVLMIVIVVPELSLFIPTHFFLAR